MTNDLSECLSAPKGNWLLYLGVEAMDTEDEPAEKIAKGNPNHDEAGRFASSGEMLSEELIGDGTYGGSSMSRLSIASIKRIAARVGIDPRPYLSIKDGPAGTRTGRNKLESAILYTDRSASAEKIAKQRLRSHPRFSCPTCGMFIPAGSQTCSTCSPGTGNPEVSTQGIESTPDHAARQSAGACFDRHEGHR